MKYSFENHYLKVGKDRLFTTVMLPEAGGKFPTVIIRDPYTEHLVDMSDEKTAIITAANQEHFLKAGYAVVYQHCRGRGKSEGDFIPYINERDDGLALQSWIREQSFYNGELFLWGLSYLSTVHYVTAPWAKDICGAALSVQDTNRYNLSYRNGFFKKGIHGQWIFTEYKRKKFGKIPYNPNVYNTLPLSRVMDGIYGERMEDFEELIKHPDSADDFWKTHAGGGETRGVTENTHVPLLLTTGLYDIYTGGIFEMWQRMSKETKSRSALLVSPYSHNDILSQSPLVFPDGRREEHFGKDYEVEWFDYLRKKRAEAPFELGKITYYRMFENKWKAESEEEFYNSNAIRLPLGKDEVTYTYNPFDAPTFRGGLCTNFGGAEFQDAPNLRRDIITVYSEAFDRDVFIKGRMRARLRVKTDCEDTCFYMRVSVECDTGDLGLRDDITSVLYQQKDYKPGEETYLNFDFDEHAFLLRRGARLRIDISSANSEHYVRHTNNKGLFSEQTTARIAKNTVFLGDSYLEIPEEK